ncbi:ParA family protein [Streptomyces sp. NRRL B-24484]|uniref:ParA family protein n=1 Tax=Streptomyces sp. NRRL B-24484 TaxID=1463833 RepID=UPI000694C0C9|nr:AAA family ATPase [Streptomyces sp. NRRL B-24484]
MPPTLPSTRVLAFTNQSGGAGKSTGAVTVGAWLAKYKLKVLVVDLDAQCDAAAALGYDQPDLLDNQPTLYDLLIGVKGVTVQDAIVPAMAGPVEDPASKTIDGLDLLLPSVELESVEQLLTGRLIGREMWLRETLAPVLDDYDVVLLDCPGNLGLVVVNALVLATEVVACVKPGWKELRALTRIEQTIDRVNESFGPNGAAPQFAWILMSDAPTKRTAGVVYAEAQEQARKAYGDIVLPAVRRSTRVPESYAAQQALPFFDLTAEVTADYAAVVKAMGFRRQK